jgi:hypothetical protein
MMTTSPQSKKIFLKILENNDANDESFYEYLVSEQEDEDCTVSTPARNYCTHASMALPR